MRIAGTLIIVSLALPWVEAVYLQVDLIPESVWAQYPIIILFAVAVGFVAKQQLQNNREWREFLAKENELRRIERQEERQQFINAQMEIIRYALEEISSQQVEQIMAKLPQYDIKTKR